MPQPFPYKHGVLDYAAVAVAARPELAIKIAIAMDSWSTMEHQVAMGFVGLLQGSEEGAYRAYNAVFDRGLRETIFLAVAKERLSVTVFAKLEAFFVRFRRVSSFRNTIAHARWAIISTRPDTLLLCPVDFRLRDAHDFSKWALALSRWNLERSLEGLEFSLKAKRRHGMFSRFWTRSRKATIPAVAAPEMPDLKVKPGTMFTEYSHSDFEEFMSRVKRLSTEFQEIITATMIEIGLKQLGLPAQADEPRLQNIP